MGLLVLIQVLERQEGGERGEVGDRQGPGCGVPEREATDDASQPEEDARGCSDAIGLVHFVRCLGSDA